MTEPVVQHKTTVRPYAQANAGVTNYMEGGVSPRADLEVGARLNSGNIKAEAGLRAGTDLGARIGADYTLPVSKKVGINFNAGGDYSKNLLPDTYAMTHININLQQGEKTSLGMSSAVDVCSDMYKGYVGAGVKVQPNQKFNFTIGAEGGVKGTTRAVSFDTKEKFTDNNLHIHQCIDTHVSKVEPYITPKVAAEYNINPKMSVNLQGDFNGAKAGFCYTF